MPPYGNLNRARGRTNGREPLELVRPSIMGVSGCRGDAGGFGALAFCREYGLSFGIEAKSTRFLTLPCVAPQGDFLRCWSQAQERPLLSPPLLRRGGSKAGRRHGAGHADHEERAGNDDDRPLVVDQGTEPFAQIDFVSALRWGFVQRPSRWSFSPVHGAVTGSAANCRCLARSCRKPARTQDAAGGTGRGCRVPATICRV